MRTTPTLSIVERGLILAAIVTSVVLQPADVQGRGQSGKEVVEKFCASCHATGANGAPVIGDEKAWRERASQGLSALTRHALEGIRQMPAHGGQPQLTDLEIARAITYMVNHSGGDWVQPAPKNEIMAERTGEAVVKSYCAECHQEGKQGAPPVGDRGAWVQRLRQGLPYAVHSAIRGHGGMPPRGGAADLTDDEIRDAILYMFNPQTAAMQQSVPSPDKRQPVSAEGNHANVGGMDIYIGFVPAERLRTFPPGSAERSMHGGIPLGDNWYHMNVSLLNEVSRAPVTGAKVAARLQEVGGSAVSKTLEPMAIGEGSYGNYFPMASKTLYEVVVRVQASEGSSRVVAEFEHEHY